MPGSNYHYPLKAAKNNKKYEKKLSAYISIIYLVLCIPFAVLLLQNLCNTDKLFHLVSFHAINYIKQLFFQGGGRVMVFIF